MTTRIKIWYSEIGGEDIPTPHNYPEELEFPGRERGEITDKLVAQHIQEHIERAGAERCHVMFIWDIVTEVRPRYTVH